MKYLFVSHKCQFLIFCFLLAGCLSSCMPSIKYGIPPKVDRLKNLKVGESTRADVLMTLGEPRGRGAARFSDADALKYGASNYYDLWFYEYIQAEYPNVQLKFLVVLIDQDHYSGHFWFSSSQLHEVE